jgi:hypothetical protein
MIGLPANTVSTKGMTKPIAGRLLKTEFITMQKKAKYSRPR